MANQSMLSQANRALIVSLDRIRVRRDLTYHQLAVEIGLSPRNVFRLLNDRRA
jgi:DNA-binding Xre family transcriptional regulator